MSVKVRVATLAATAAGVLQIAPVYGDDTQTRCNEDSLDPTAARVRLEWARACGTRINLQDPVNAPAPAFSYDTTIPAANGGTLWEYIETDHFNGWKSYSGVVASVNDMFTKSQWRVGPTSTSIVAGGFQKWTRPAALALPRPSYPTFGTHYTPQTPGWVKLYPHPSHDPNNCNFYADPAGTQPVDTTGTGFYVNGYCTSSCYTPDQVVRFATGDEAIIDALTARRSGVTTVAPGSSLQSIRLTTDEIGTYTRELIDTTHVIFEIRTRSGGELRVTDKHPVIEGSGRIVEAKSLKAGQHLIKANGARDMITSVTQTSHFGKVYNLKPRSTNRVSNLLVAQGFLVGSSRYQNEDVDYVNRIILGRAVPKDVIPQ